MTITDPSWEEPEFRSVDEVDAFEDDEFPENATVGTLTFSFTWTDFATVDDGRLTLQDTFLTEAGDPWYGTLGSDERLIIEAPEDHDFETAPRGIDSGQLVWHGPYEFEAEDFDIVLDRRSGPLSTLLGSWVSLMGGVAVLLLGGGVLWYALSHRDQPPGVPIPPTSADETAGSVADADGTSAGETAGDVAVGAGAAGVADTDGGADARDEPADDDGIDPELLSDEERVTRMLKDNGGRMKQAAIVKETGWSNAKVSQLLSQMDEDDEIEKLRIGRENLITLPDVDPTQVE